MNLLPELTYAPYVWGSIAVFLVVFFWDAFTPWLRLRRLRRDIAQRARRSAARTSPIDTQSP